MTEENKKEIAALLRERLASKGADGKPLSQRGWGDANRISNATVNQVLRGKWDLISDEMWRKFASALNYSSAQWELGRTRDYILLNKWLAMAQKQGTTLAISHEPGGGKTATLQHFADTHPNVFFLGAMPTGPSTTSCAACTVPWARTPRSLPAWNWPRASFCNCAAPTAP